MLQQTPSSSVTALIKSQPEVVDFLISLLYAAATSNSPKGYNRNGLGLPENSANRTSRIVLVFVAVTCIALLLASFAPVF